ncbi:hypothetical protein FRB90_003346 [Tulasnella sp. 427]|nr:hypothetical protein FRB90_003346 [Tulasnella sp. 427]
MATSPEDSQSIESRLATVRPRLSFRSAVSRVIKSVADQTEKPATPAFRIDKQLQEECVDQFVQFQKKLKDLEVEIDKFTGAVRPLGSSSGLIFSAIRLPRRMREIGDIFYANASFIYDTFGESRRSELPQNFKTYAPDNVDRDPGSVGDFPNLLRGLASELREFLDSLRDIPEFSDKALPESLEMFASWLEYRAGGLEEFDYQLHTPALRRYTNSLMAEMEKHLKQTGDALSRFGKDGVLAIKTAQDRAKEQLLNMSTVYTADKQGGILDEIVRALWVSSLILSIASAINSQLAMHWRTAMYRSPRSALPMWISICLTQTPLLFLVFAVLTFSVGLVIYTYSSVQGKLVTLCATVLTSFTSLILLAVILWEGGERWQAHKSGIKGEEVGPGVPVVHEPWDPYKRFVNWSRYLLHECRKACKTLFAIFTGRPAKSRDHLPTITPGAAHFSKHGIVSGLGPSATVGALRSLPYESRDSASQSIGTVQPEQSHQESSTSPSRSLKVDTQTVDFASSNQDESNISPVTMYGRTMDHRFSEVAWRLAVDSMERDLLRLLEGEGDDLAVPVRWNSISYHPTSRPSDPVQDLRFAPDGRWLAASTRDESTALWQVDRDLILNSEFAAGHGGIIWDDDGLAFSVSSKDGVTRWEIEVLLFASVKRHHYASKPT